jgi:hypothetical protein
MARTAVRCTAVVVRLIAIGMAALGSSLARAQTPANSQEAPSVEMRDFGVVPRPAVTQVLLRLPAIQDELKLTEAQKKEQAELADRQIQRIRKARTEITDRAEFRRARNAIVEEADAAQLASLKPEQRERLAQIQIQAQGPLAFSSWGGDPGSERRGVIGPPVSARLGLSADQVKRARTIAEEGDDQIR